jgi:ABC-2 type transport system ATP-binding protein
MPEGQVLEFTHVTKRFNEVTAVSDFSARVEPGAVTAFLGPNGAGKTTTLRILLGQVRATSGTATIGGTAYAELRQPLRTIGAVLEETVYRPRRTAERQLTIAAKANGIPLARVGEVLSLVGLEGEGDSRIGGFSLGMRQRLSVAHALLGDPGALVFDEPANGLDPEGIRWMRLLMRRLADEGRTVLVSSHVLSEVEQVADNVLVLSKGTLVLASGIETLADPKGGSVIVDAADRAALTSALAAAGFDIEVLRSGLTVRGGDAGTVGAVAADAGIALSTLVQRGPTLEDVFIDLMRGGRFAPSAPATPQHVAASPSESAPEGAAPEDAAAEDTAAEGAVSESGPAPVDSVVAIPVGAAAAWAAEAASAPAGEAVADDLAASVATDDGTERIADAPDAPSADADAAREDAPEEGAADADALGAEADTDTDATAVGNPEADNPDAHGVEADGEEPTDEQPTDEQPSDEQPSDEQGADEQGRDVQDDAVSIDDAPARSFDEILFGAAAPVESTDGPSADLTADDEDHSGVEVFADLHETTDGTEADAAAAAAAADDEHEEAASSEDDNALASHVDDADADPRAAAVSSMLAAAARAYYEDEPKDYPLGAGSETAESETAEGAPAVGEDTADDSAEEGAHWTVASTGVIDTVPLDESSGAASEENGSDGSGTEHHDGENHDDEHRHDEHRHDEHRHDDEHHQG